MARKYQRPSNESASKKVTKGLNESWNGSVPLKPNESRLQKVPESINESFDPRVPRRPNES